MKEIDYYVHPVTSYLKQLEQRIQKLESYLNLLEEFQLWTEARKEYERKSK